MSRWLRDHQVGGRGGSTVVDTEPLSVNTHRHARRRDPVNLLDPNLPPARLRQRPRDDGEVVRVEPGYDVGVENEVQQGQGGEDGNAEPPVLDDEALDVGVVEDRQQLVDTGGDLLFREFGGRQQSEPVGC